jgi:hypothetical protein
MKVDGKWHMWGCSATKHYQNMLREAQQHKGNDAIFFTVNTTLGSTVYGGLSSEVEERLNRKYVRAQMDAQFRVATYMAQAVRVLGLSVLGAPPGAGSSFKNNRMFVDEAAFPVVFAYFRDQFAPEFQPTSLPYDTGYVDYARLALRARPVVGFESDYYYFERNADLFRPLGTRPRPFTRFMIADGRELTMVGLDVTLTERLIPDFSAPHTRGFLYELRDTTDDSKSLARYVRDDGKVFLVRRDPADQFTILGPEITGGAL